ncbi:hypothetical protein RchiOBHm_Chr5g0050461 [Rosa chinensis]|uniref:Uncharacterized protein n=1 Tax=Rosa chinensis TaxID=74649 RepID=A0A2P6QF38_ROSCH|nr:hypothetical protein RchiOBHm_Chr5g0050461 [Rosa chinensis]
MVLEKMVEVLVLGSCNEAERSKMVLLLIKLREAQLEVGNQGLNCRKVVVIWVSMKELRRIWVS